MRLLIVVVLLGLAAQLWANDCRVTGLGGQMHRMHGKSTTVRMVREWVNIDLFPDGNHVLVQFVFQNDGPATTVTMGFPEKGYGDVDGAAYRKKSSFRNFHTRVDGREVKVVRQSAYGEEDTYKAYWVKTVSFAQHQQHWVRVEYVTDPGSYASGMGHGVYGDFEEQSANYDFTGGNWKGVVEESNLRVTFHLPGNYLIASDTPLTQKANTLFYRWTNWRAEKAFSLGYYRIRADAMSLRAANDKPSYYCIAVPGNAPDSQIAPAIIDKQGVAFVSLEQLAQCRNLQHRDTTLNWDEKTHEATFTAEDHTLHCVLKNPIMRVEGSPDVTLPIAPFLSTPITHYGKQTSYLYVPLLPIVHILGGEAEIDATHRVVTLSLPPHQ